MYFIDKLALRAGNEKDTDESADTVGCCSLRVEHMSKEEREGGKGKMGVLILLGVLYVWGGRRERVSEC